MWSFYKEYLEQNKKERAEEVEALIRSAFADSTSEQDNGEEGVYAETQTQE